jgi:hypothetical protein
MSAVLQAQGYFVDVDIDKTTLREGEQFAVTYSLKHDGQLSRQETANFILPEVGPELKVIKQNGQNIFYNQNINGKVTLTLGAFVVYFKATEKGTYSIGPGKYKIAGTEYYSESLRIKVVDEAASPAVSEAESIFIEAVISDFEPWKGEEIRISYKLWSKHNLLAVSQRLPPNIEGFTVKESQVQSNTLRSEKRNGQVYSTLPLYEATLYPIRAGEFVLDPFSLTVTADVPTGRIIRSIWGDRPEVTRQSLKVSSQRFKINVRGLPTAGVPADFMGAIGQFDLESSISSEQTETGDPITLQIAIKGQGDLRTLPEPQLDLPPGFEAYDPEISTRNNRKDFAFLLIPSRPGNFTLPPYRFSYFDTKEERYITRETPEYAIQVGQGDEPILSGTSGAGFSQEEVEKLGEDIRFIQTNVPAFVQAGAPLFGSTIFYAGLFTPLLLLIPLFILGRRRRASLGDEAGLRRGKARSVARKRLKKSQELLGGDAKAFYNELIRAIWGYLEDKYGMSREKLSRDNIREALSQKGVDETDISGLIGLLDRAEMALFAPIDPGAPQSDLELAEKILELLEARA